MQVLLCRTHRRSGHRVAPGWRSHRCRAGAHAGCDDHRLADLRFCDGAEVPGSGPRVPPIVPKVAVYDERSATCVTSAGAERRGQAGDGVAAIPRADRRGGHARDGAGAQGAPVKGDVVIGPRTQSEALTMSTLSFLVDFTVSLGTSRTFHIFSCTLQASGSLYDPPLFK